MAHGVAARLALDRRRRIWPGVLPPRRTKGAEAGRLVALVPDGPLGDQTHGPHLRDLGAAVGLWQGAVFGAHGGPHGPDHGGPHLPGPRRPRDAGTAGADPPARQLPRTARVADDLHPLQVLATGDTPAVRGRQLRRLDRAFLLLGRVRLRDAGPR